ncbi:hypothetical protein B0H11DRAFT_2300511 [Mycena galericulata]|nr:hypothetical protein B0H11DRAFT_2300511 [Mycena galericulata]
MRETWLRLPISPRFDSFAPTFHFTFACLIGQCSVPIPLLAMSGAFHSRAPALTGTVDSLVTSDPIALCTTDGASVVDSLMTESSPFGLGMRIVEFGALSNYVAPQDTSWVNESSAKAKNQASRTSATTTSKQGQRDWGPGAFFFLINGAAIKSKVAGNGESNLRKASIRPARGKVLYIDTFQTSIPELLTMWLGESEANVLGGGNGNGGGAGDPVLNQITTWDEREEEHVHQQRDKQARPDRLYTASRTSRPADPFPPAGPASILKARSNPSVREICQRAAKLAICENIESDIRRTREE